MAQRLFPGEDHDHSKCAHNLMHFAEKHCEQAGLRLTRLRRDVLKEVAASHKAIGAYQILDNFAGQGRKLSPISVYRSLEFLQEAGLIHRLESTNAFFACQRTFDKSDDCCGDAPLVFLICDQCGTIGEVDGQPIAETIDGFASDSGFETASSQVEIKGMCRQCQSS